MKDMLFKSLYFRALQYYIPHLAASCIKAKEMRGNKSISHFHLKRFPLDSALLKMGGAAVDVPAGRLLSLPDDP